MGKIIFEVKVRFLPTNQGGRSNNLLNKYSCSLFFDLDNFVFDKESHKRYLNEHEQNQSRNISGTFYFDRKKVDLGREYVGVVTFPDVYEEFLNQVMVGSHFLACEMVHVVGEGVLIRKIDNMPFDLESSENNREIADLLAEFVAKFGKKTSPPDST